MFVEVELLHLALIFNAMDVQLKCLHLIHELILDLHLLLKQLASLFIDMPVNLVEFTHHLTTLLVLKREYYKGGIIVLPIGPRQPGKLQLCL
jgi:hypothetical protein